MFDKSANLSNYKNLGTSRFFLHKLAISRDPVTTNTDAACGNVGLPKCRICIPPSER